MLPRSRGAQAKQRLRIGLLMTCGTRLDDEVRSAVEAMAMQAETLGYDLEPVEIDFAAQEKHILTLLRVGFSARLSETLKAQPI